MSETKTTIQPKIRGKKQYFSKHFQFLEIFTRTHILVPVTLFVVIAIGLMGYAFQENLLNPLNLASLFFGGLLFFTLFEYIMHRYTFHMSTNTKLKATIQYAFHGIHHEYPKDKGRLAMPPLLSLTISTVLFLLFRLAMGNYVFGFLAGFLVGYSAYLGVHYMVHAFRAPNNIFKVLWINHGIHHYKDDHLAYGVSSPLWDWVFGTLPKRD